MNRQAAELRDAHAALKRIATGDFPHLEADAPDVQFLVASQIEARAFLERHAPDVCGFGVCRCGLPRVGKVRGIYNYSFCRRRSWWNFWRHDRPFRYGVRV